jgi:ubiquinone/menaquinone biosynthesis C-methylase UbiE
VTQKVKLQLFPLSDFARDNPSDPIRFYFWPVLGPLYRRRVEMCLEECRGGESVLEVGFGIGLTFQNLAQAYQEIHGIDLLADVEKVGNFFREKQIQTHLINGNVLDMPYPDNMFDTVILVSILEHLKPEDQPVAMQEIRRVLKPGGQMVYGVPVERPFMVFMYRVMGVNIRELHFSTEKEISQVADRVFQRFALRDLKSFIPGMGSIYQVGHYVKG